MSAAAANPQRASQASLARLLGVSRQAINDLVKRQIIPIGADGLIDVELAHIAIANRIRPSGKTAGQAAVQTTTPSPPAAQAPSSLPSDPPVADAQLSYHIAKTLRETAEARKAQLELAEMRRDLVRVADVRADLARRFAQIREALLQIPSRLVPLLVAEPSPPAMDRLLRAEITDVLQRLSTEDTNATP